ncbi:MAG: acyltransferase [Verrucomicrobia bacterium]|nr:acyltransferase [Verrucomicrobiota bacterium]
MIPAKSRFDALLYFCNRIVANLPSATVRQYFYRHVMQLDLAPGVRILSGLWLDCRAQCSIGRNTIINQNCWMDNRGGIRIGANVSISPFVHIITADHDLSSPEFVGCERPVCIGDRVFIGSRATILPGVTLGEGCGVGAGSVVTKNVEPGTIVAGVPARPVGHRPLNLRYELSYRRRFF